MESSERVKTFYEGEVYFLSNFSSFRVVYRGHDYMSSEHAYQAAKYENPVFAQMIREARSAHEAFKLTRTPAFKAQQRKDWDEVKLGVMEEILRAKLAQHEYVRRKLLETGSARLVEDSPVDSFWGRGPDWEGENHLGRLWMKLRDELAAQAA